MRIKCLASRGHELPAEFRGLYFTHETTFHIVIGVDYEAYAMALFNSGLIVLVVDATGKPEWYPMEFFEVIDGRISSDWVFAPRSDGPDGTVAVWGPPRLAMDQALDEALALHDKEALSIFWSEVANVRRGSD